MRRQGSLLTMAAIVLGLSAFAGYLRSARSGGPKLEIENPGQLILGKVSVQDPCLRTVRIKNVGNLAITRGKFQVSCGCSRVTPSAFALPPGEAVDVQLEFDFLSLTNQHEIPVAREFSVALPAVSQAPVPAVFQWPIRGVIHSVYQRVPAVVEFATRAPPAEAVTGEVEFRFHEPIERLLVSSDDAGVAVQMNDAGPGKAFRCGVAVELSEFGEREVVLRAAPLVEGELLSPLRTKVIVQRLADVEAQPGFLNFGVVEPGEVARAMLRLASHAAMSFQVNEILCRPADSSPTSSAEVVRAAASEWTADEYLFLASAREPGTYSGKVAIQISQGTAVYQIQVPYVFHVASNAELAARNRCAEAQELIMKPAVSQMAVSTSHFLMPLFCLLSLAAVPARGQELSLDFLRAQIQQRVARFATVDYSWTATSHFTPEHARLVGAAPFEQSPADVRRQFPATFQWQGRLRCDGVKMRLEHNRPTWYFARRRFEQHQETETFDGETGMGLSLRQEDPFPLRGGIGNDVPTHMAGAEVDFGPLLCYFRSLTFPGMLFDRVLVEGAQITSEQLEGHARTVIRRRERTADVRVEDTLWLDPQAGYAPRRWMVRINGGLDYDIRLELQSVGGQVLPKSIRREDYNCQTGQLRATTSIEMTTATIGEPLADDIFRIEFPAGTVLTDGRKRKEAAQTASAAETASAITRTPPASVSVAALAADPPRPAPRRRVIIDEALREHEFDERQVKGVRSVEELLDVVARRERFRGWRVLLGGSMLLVIAAACVILLRQRRHL